MVGGIEMAIELFNNPKEGDLRAWHIINGKIVDLVPIKSREEAKHLIKKWVEQDLKDSSIEFNAMGIEEYDPYFKDDEDTKGWTEQYSENGDDIMEEMGY